MASFADPFGIPLGMLRKDIQAVGPRSAEAWLQQKKRHEPKLRRGAVNFSGLFLLSRRSATDIAANLLPIFHDRRLRAQLVGDLASSVELREGLKWI
jgi:hypothetical protein